MELLKIWEILHRRRFVFIGVFCVFFFSVVLVTFLATPVYRSSVKVLVKSSSDPESSLLSALGLKSSSTTLTSTDDEFETDIAMSQITPVLERLIRELDLKDGDGRAITPDGIMSMGFLHKTLFPQPYIKIVQFEDASMLKIMTYSTDAREAADMADKFAEFFIEHRVVLAKDEYGRARAEVEARIDKARDDYYKSLSALTQYKLKEGFVNIDTETDNLLTKISTLQGSYDDSERSLIEYDKRLALYAEKIKSIDKYRKETETVSDNSLLQSLRAQLADLIIDLKAKSLDMTKEHPSYKALEIQIDTIKELMEKEASLALSGEGYGIDPVWDTMYKELLSLNVEKEVTLAKMKAVKILMDRYKSDLMLMPVRDEAVNQLNSDISVYKSLYQNLFGYLTQVQMAETIALSNINVVEPATIAERKYFPKKAFNYIAGMVMGSFIALIVALAFDYIDTTLKTPDEIRAATGMAILGTVPRSKRLRESRIIAGLEPFESEVDAFRTIKNAIGFGGGDSVLKSIAVTGAYRGEGRSTIASNVAVMMAGDGKKTLFIDMNPISPAAGRFFGRVDESAGISDVLGGRLTLQGGIQPSGIVGLDVISYGSVSIDALRLDVGEKLRATIGDLSATYDAIVVDTPPIASYNDAVVIGRFVDGVVHVIESGRNSLAAAAQTSDMMRRASVKVIGAVVNKYRLF